MARWVTFGKGKNARRIHIRSSQAYPRSNGRVVVHRKVGVPFGKEEFQDEDMSDEDFESNLSFYKSLRKQGVVKNLEAGAYGREADALIKFRIMRASQKKAYVAKRKKFVDRNWKMM